MVSVVRVHGPPCPSTNHRTASLRNLPRAPSPLPRLPPASLPPFPFPFIPQALALQPGHVKALYRRARARHLLGQTEGALKDLGDALARSGGTGRGRSDLTPDAGADRVGCAGLVRGTAFFWGNSACESLRPMRPSLCWLIFLPPSAPATNLPPRCFQGAGRCGRGQGAGSCTRDDEAGAAGPGSVVQGEAASRSCCNHRCC